MFYYDKDGNKIQQSSSLAFNKVSKPVIENYTENNNSGGCKCPMWVLIMLVLIALGIIIYLIWYFMKKD
jgi:hypothetical protein